MEIDAGRRPPHTAAMSSAFAAVFHGSGRPWEFRSWRLPEPGTGEVLVRIRLATICGSDLHTVGGRRHGPTPCVLGHEGVGEVLAVGPGRDSRLVGQRVSWTLADSCGACRPCRDWDLPQKCDHLFKYGHEAVSHGSGWNGCYATHLILRRGTTIVPVPAALTDAMAAPVNCALATMVAATGPLGASGETAILQGAGLLGIYGCTLLKAAGWRRVIVVDRDPQRLALASRFGAECCPAAEVAGLPPGSADTVLEVCGDPAVIAEGLRLLRPGGTYGWIGLVHPESNVSLTAESVIRRCATIRGTHNYAPRHLEEAFRFLEAHAATHPWHLLVSPPEPLRNLGAAMDLARTGRWARVGVRPVEET